MRKFSELRAQMSQESRARADKLQEKLRMSIADIMHEPSETETNLEQALHVYRRAELIEKKKNAKLTKALSDLVEAIEFANATKGEISPESREVRNAKQVLLSK